MPGLLLSRRAQYLLAFAAAVVLAFVAWKLRMLPYYNYEHVYRIAVNYGIKSDVARYAYINANDPWIEYWLASYLHSHGLGSWTTLTRANPATHIFWYPWGRDFTKTDYPLVPMMAAATGDPLWGIDIVPVLAGVALVFAAFVFAADLYGPLAGVLAALLLAVIPAAASRTFAGFTEKTGIAMPFVVLALWLYARMLRCPPGGRRWLAYMAGAAVFWLLTELTWGGYALLHGTLALTVLAVPLILGLDASLTALERSFALFLVFSVAAYALEAIGYGHVSNTFTLAVLAVFIMVYVAVEYLRRLQASPRGRLERYAHRVEKLYVAYVVTILAVGIAAGYAAGMLNNKYGYTILWPLRDLGLIHMGRVEETVAEMSSAFHGNFRGFVSEANIVFFLAPIADLYLLYVAWKRRRLDHVPHTLLGLVLFYGVLGMLYLLQSFATINALTVAAAGGLLLAGQQAGAGRAGRRRRGGGEHIPGEVKLLIGIVYVLIVIIGSAYAASITAKTLGATAATITGSTRNNIYLDWLWTLQHFKYDVPRSDVVVAWWDYGYWISVGSGHPTLADGATLNGTQLRLLARFMTGSDEEANKILYMLHLKPNETYVLINDIGVYNPKTGTFTYFFPFSGIDLMKSWAMHHIAGRDEKFNKIIDLIRNMIANPSTTPAYRPALLRLLNDTMVFKLAVDGAFELQRHGVIVPARFEKLFGTRKVKQVNLYAIPITGELKMKHFKPYMTIVSPIMTTNGSAKVTRDGSIYVHLVIVYKWTG